MNPISVFVDGREGTTGLQIDERLSKRSDVRLIDIDEGKRKDPAARKACIHAADIVFFCLPDDAARESVALADGSRARILDASTAHRTHPAWVYGLPELNRDQRARIADATRVAVPGCHATGFVLASAPLVQQGVINPSTPLAATSITGFSGGGKKLIARYENPQAARNNLSAPQPYALGLRHKHAPEMQHWSGLAQPPVFLPVVSCYFQGMLVSVPLALSLLARKMTARDLAKFYADFYAGYECIRVVPYGDETFFDEGFLDPTGCNGTNRADFFVTGHDDQALVTVRIDNLGKGASGAAIQCINILCGLPELTSLTV